MKILFLLFLTLFLSLPSQLNAEEESEKDIVDLVIRYGQGGFRDSRSPEDALGGGEITLDVKPSNFPVAVSISSQFYTNGPEPTHSYEIKSIRSVSLLYMNRLQNYERINYFFGLGVGWLEVPSDYDNSNNSGALYSFEAGVRVRVYGGFGVYVNQKYLNAQSEQGGEMVIDFKEHITLVGIAYAFSL